MLYSEFDPAAAAWLRELMADGLIPVSTASYRQAKNGKQIAVLSVRGPMIKPASWFGVSTVQLRNDLRMAAANPEVLMDD